MSTGLGHFSENTKFTSIMVEFEVLRILSNKYDGAFCSETVNN